MDSWACCMAWKNYELAAKFFTNFSISLKDDVWHQASGAVFGQHDLMQSLIDTKILIFG